MTTPLQKAAQAVINQCEVEALWASYPWLGAKLAGLRKALNAEIAQSVEPFAWKEFTPDGSKWFLAYGKNSRAKQEPLYLHPPQPHAEPEQSGERAELILRLAKQWAELDPADPYRADVGQAVDMLKADAQQANRVPQDESEDLYALALKADNWGQP